MIIAAQETFKNLVILCNRNCMFCLGSGQVTEFLYEGQTFRLTKQFKDFLLRDKTNVFGGKERYVNCSCVSIGPIFFDPLRN